MSWITSDSSCQETEATGVKTSQWICLVRTTPIRAAPILFPHDQCSLHTHMGHVASKSVNRNTKHLSWHYQRMLYRHSTFATLTCDFAIGNRLCWQKQTKASWMHIPNNVLQYGIHQFGLYVKLCTKLKYKTSTYCCHPFHVNPGSYPWLDECYIQACNNKGCNCTTMAFGSHRCCSRIATILIGCSTWSKSNWH